MWRCLSAGLMALVLVLCVGGSAHSSSQTLPSSSHPSASYPELSGEEIALCLKVYDRFVERLDALLIGERPQRPDGGIDFWAAAAKVKKSIDQAEDDACTEHGMERSRYHAVLDRLLAVQECKRYFDVLEQLNPEIERLENMTEEDLREEAERSYREAEDWIEGLQKELDIARQKRDAEKRRYLDSIEKYNEDVREYNRNLSPSPEVKRLRDQLAREQAKLKDSRYASMRKGIEGNIAEMEAALVRLEKKDGHRRKTEKEPDPAVINSFDRTVNIIEQNIASYIANVVQPIRNQRAAGNWLNTVKEANEKQLREKQETVRQLQKILSHPRLQQAAVDLKIVDQMVDREKLMSLKPAMPGGFPPQP